MLSGSFLVYRIQLSLPRVISCHFDNHSAHPVRQWPESRVAYPTKVPGAALENGKAPWRTFLDSKHLARAKMLDSGRGYHEPSALELIGGYHGQQKQQACDSPARSPDGLIPSSPFHALTGSGMYVHLSCKPICMENDPNNADAPVTKADLKAEFGKFEERLDKKLDRLLSEQANVILEAVSETMEKKLDEKFDPVVTKLDGVLKGIEALQQENTIGAEQLRRHEDQLQKHETRIAKLETAPA